VPGKRRDTARNIEPALLQFLAVLVIQRKDLFALDRRLDLPHLARRGSGGVDDVHASIVGEE
jgi:hypothetical protein